MPARVRLACLGFALGLGAPIGWSLLSWAGFQSETSLYVYLLLSTTTVFAAFGYTLGALQDRLRELARTDPLTGLLNQAGFFEAVDLLLRAGRRRKAPLSLVMVDTDRFKIVNDDYGHVFGSHVLKEVARVMARVTRESDVVGRYGGDEFILCLPDTTALQARELAERVRRTIEGTGFVQGDERVHLTVSLGVAEAPAGGESPRLSRLVQRADEALYAAKSAGRNRVAVAAAEPAERCA